MKKLYIFCGILCFCFLCVGAYFLVSPLFASSSANSSQIPEDENDDTKNDEEQEIIFLSTDYSEIYLSLDEENARITYKILPADEIPNIIVEDISVLTVENFLIKPHKVGRTKVILSHRDITKEILVTVFEKQATLTFSSQKFNSGLDKDENYISYTATINFNFDYKNITINLSENIEVVNEEKTDNSIVLTFNILYGTNFIFDITIDKINIYREMLCEEIQTDDNNLEEPNPINPDDSNEDETSSDESTSNPLNTYHYEIYYNGFEIDDYLEIELSTPSYIIVNFNIFDSNSNEQNFTSKVEIEDEDNITRDSISIDYQQITILFFSKGEVKVTLSSLDCAISKTFTLKIK